MILTDLKGKVSILNAQISILKKFYANNIDNLTNYRIDRIICFR
jgi:hypothetical protein